MYNPLVSEYKIDFIANRLLHTFFGGLDFGYDQDASYIIYLCKLVLFIYPFLIGVVFNLFIHLEILNQLLSGLLSGVISFLITIFIHILAKRQNSVQIFPSTDRKPTNRPKRLFRSLMPLVYMKSRISMLIHSIFSFCLVGSAVYQINTILLLKNFNDQWLTSIVLYLMSWFTLIISHNSLTVGPPPETATFSTLETNDFISTLNRPIHVLIISFLQLLNTTVFENSKLLNILCPIMLSLFPILWLIGFIPPVTALFQWSVERVNVIMFGGGPSYLTFKSCIQLVLSVILMLISWGIDKPVPLIYISTIFGFLMSNDIKINLNCNEIKIYRIIVYSLLIISIIITNLVSIQLDLELILLNKWLILMIGILLSLVTFIKYSQSVYLFFGIIRNPLYPKSSSGINVFKKFKQQFKNPIVLMKILIQFILPIICLLDINIELKQYFNTRVETMAMTSTNITETNEKLISFSTAFAVLSIHRSIWQKTCFTSLVLIISNLQMYTNRRFFGLSLPLEWLSFNFILNLMLDFFEKLYLVSILMITSVILKKQRFPMTSCLISFDLLIFPLIISMILISSIISAPILPVFTLPIFLISFSRPTHFWPNINKSEIETNDTIYYQQMMPEFIESLIRQCPIISTCRVGTFLLARFDDRLILIQMLESGFNFLRIQVKGLELQETSCHAVEATAIDEMIDEAFYTFADKKFQPLNSYFWYTLQPLDTVITRTYSDARNVLTGVIDSPETFIAIKTLFNRVFVWVLLNHRLKKVNNFSRIQTQESVISSNGKQVDSTTFNPNLEAKSVLFYDVLKTQTQTENTTQHLNRFEANIVLSKWSDEEDESDVLGTVNNVSQHSQQNRTTDFQNQRKESNGDIVEENDETFEKVFQNRTENELNMNSNSELNTRESFFNTFEDNNNKMLDRNVSSSDESQTYSLKQMETNSKSEDLFSSLFPTDEWLTASLDYMYRKQINQSLNQFVFSEDWFKCLINRFCDNSAQQQVMTDTQMSSLIESYKQIVLVCFSSIFPSNPMSKTNEMNAQTIYQIFDGKVSDNGYNQKFFDRNPDLYEIIIKSFRYCLKIALDLILMAEDMPSNEQLIDVLIDYDNNWFIGDELSAEWKNCLIEEKKHLFSIGKDAIKECFTSHLLSLQEIAVHLFHLNRAVIEAIWSSLSLELLYLTNDDDERFSIQANPVIVRNLTVQAANVPIGYPVYVSHPILINHLNF